MVSRTLSNSDHIGSPSNASSCLKAPHSSDEQARLKSLYAYQILDSAREAEYDRIAQAAATVCEADYAAICFLDYNRGWIKAGAGIPSKSISRHVAPSAYALDHPGPLVIEDLSSDARFDHSWLVNEPYGMRGFAATQILSKDGHHLGAIWVAYKTPCQIDSSALTALLALSNNVTDLLELRILQTKLAEAESLLEKQIEEQQYLQKQLFLTEYLKSQFVQNINHELRTPLNALVGLTELISETQLNEHQATMVNVLRGNTQTLNTLVEDLLNFSRLEAGETRVELNECNLGELAKEIASRYQSITDSKKLKLEVHVSPSPYLLADESHIRQALMHVLDNAVKFTQQGQITLSFELERDTPYELCAVFKIRDTGIGIAPELHQEIFNGFQQVNGSLTRIYGGTGLGLTVANRLVQLMGGKIELTSDLGKGSEFVMSVPVQLLDNLTPATSQVLIVEPNPVDSKILQHYLHSCGLSYDLLDTAEAIESVDSSKYDLVLVTSELASLPTLSHASKLVIMGDATNVEAQITKPLKRTQLEAIFQNVSR